MNAALSAFGADFCIDACRGAIAAPVRSTGSICVAWLRGVTLPARQLDPAPRAAASLPAAAPPAAAPRPRAGGRHTVGRV
jgi:hypothetical protein